mgnify:CR=1 FL=1
MRSAKQCLDASFVIKLVLEEEWSSEARSLASSWTIQESQLFAPYHLIYEASSVIWNRVYRGILTPGAGEQAFATLHAQKFTYVHTESLFQDAWGIAQRFRRPTLYDCYYLALADMLGCDLWTADRRLYSAVCHELPWVKLLGRSQA